MQAVQVERFGVENLKVQEVADPVPGPGEVLIETEAATINPADLAIVTGTAASRFPPEAVAPYIPGWDLVGQVVRSGDGVDNTSTVPGWSGSPTGSRPVAGPRLPWSLCPPPTSS